jgi:hypothetical protein
MDPMVRRMSIENCLNLALFVNSLMPLLIFVYFNSLFLFGIYKSDFLNPVLHTWFGDSCFTCDDFLKKKKYDSPLLFKIGNRQI